VRMSKRAEASRESGGGEVVVEAGRRRAIRRWRGLAGYL